eukprot:12933-Heterococcus_DN1.PRE.3
MGGTESLAHAFERHAKLMLMNEVAKITGSVPVINGSCAACIIFCVCVHVRWLCSAGEVIVEQVAAVGA